MRKRKGDTLIEVAIAIAIFSLAAIGVVGVVHGSTSAAQAALEVTVTREEIDAQAETLRFIHNTYVTMGDSNSANYTRYEQLWQQIASRAVHTDTELNEILAFNPSSCAEIYNGTTLSKQKAFILNPRGVGAGLALNDVVVTPPGSGNGKFATAATTPRLLYNGVSGDQLLDAGENSALMSSLNSTYSTLSSAEGIYIVAVKDQGTTTMVSTDGAGNAEVHTGGAGYYDFYVRTCWYEPGAERPSTISTVIRLQDPAAADYGNAAVGNNAPGIRVFYYANATAAGGYVAPQFVNPGSSAMVQNGDGFTYADHAFVRWNTKADGTGTNYDPGNFILAPPGMTTRDTIILYAQWRDDRPASVIANIPTGTYVIKSSADLTKVMTVGGTLPGEYDLSAATLNGSDLQKWYIENLGSGVHRISAASNTGYVIDLKSASTANGNGLWSYAWNATCAQKWTVYLNPDNTYTFYSTCAGGSTMAITNDGPLRIHAFADQAVQKWVVEAPSAPVAPPVKYIQDYDVATCEKEASSAPVKVVDRRDDKEYTVRYINGNCWMTKDLAIFTSKGQPTGTITSTDSNFVNVDTWKLNATSSESYTEANAVAHSNGYGYNYCALMAGNGNSCDKYAAYTGDDDICPANWKVPSRNEIETVLGNSSEMNFSGANYWTTTYLTYADQDLGALMCAAYLNNGVYGFPEGNCIYTGNYLVGWIKPRTNHVRCMAKRKPYIQDYTNQLCAEQAQIKYVTAIDLRDNNEYRLRYADGRCWMADDLKIFTSIGEANGVVSSQNSNFANVSTWKLNVSPTPSDTQASASPGYYDFCALTAGVGCNNGYYSGSGDICPANWTVPDSGSLGRVANNDTIFNTSSGVNGSLWWTKSFQGFADSDKRPLICALKRDGDNFIYPDFGCNGTWAKSSGYYYDNNLRIRCMKQ